MKRELSLMEWEMLSDYLDNQLPSIKMISFSEKLQNDIDFREAYEDLVITRNLLRSLQRLKAPKDFIITPEILDGFKS